MQSQCTRQHDDRTDNFGSRRVAKNRQGKGVNCAVLCWLGCAALRSLGCKLCSLMLPGVCSLIEIDNGLLVTTHIL